jgi:hypothetical protein
VHYNNVIEDVGRVIDAAGVAVVVIGIGVAVIIAARSAMTRSELAYRDFRQRLGRAILLGLELLVARGHHPDRGGHADVHERRRPGRDRGDPYVPEFLTRGRGQRSLALAERSERN